MHRVTVFNSETTKAWQERLPVVEKKIFEKTIILGQLKQKLQPYIKQTSSSALTSKSSRSLAQQVLQAISDNDISLMRANYAREKNRIETLKNEKEKLTKLIEDSARFLDMLVNSPGRLLNHLTKHIHQKLDAFDCQHASNQSIFIRRQINKMRLTLQHITSLEVNADGVASQLNYLKVCGLISYIINDIEQMKKNEIEDQFHTELLQMLRATHIEHDLPDKFAVGKRAFYCFRDTCPQWTTEQLDAHEKLTYLHERDRLIQTLKSIEPDSPAESKCRALGFSLISKIDQEKKKCGDNANDQFDIKYATTVFKKTQALMKHPQDLRVQNQYKTIAHQDHSSTPSLRHIIGGTLLAILGAALIIGCILVTPLTFGASTVGMPLGLSVAIKGATLAIGAAGGVSLGGGIGFFANGFKNNIANNMKEFAKAEERRHMPTLTIEPATMTAQENNIVPHYMGLAR